jgi:hypothetical protein
MKVLQIGKDRFIKGIFLFILIFFANGNIFSDDGNIYTVKIFIQIKSDVNRLNEFDIPIYENFGNIILSKVTETQLNQLDAKGFRYEILDVKKFVPPLESEFVRGDPYATKIVKHVQDRYSRKYIEILNKDTYTNIEMNVQYTILKMFIDGDGSLVTMNQLTERITYDRNQIVTDYEEYIANLPFPYQKMSRDLRMIIRGKYGKLPSEDEVRSSSLSSEIIPVIFFADTSAELAQVKEAVMAYTDRYQVWDSDEITYEANEDPNKKDNIPPPEMNMKFVATRLPFDNILHITMFGFIKNVWYDAIFNIELDLSVPHIHGDEVHNQGWGGWFADVGIIDTGVNFHPAFESRVIAREDFTDVWWDIFYYHNPDDTNGHGTHVAGIVGSNHSAFRGMAPQAELISAKVIHGGLNSHYTSTIISGINWAINQGADIINTSLNTKEDPPIDGNSEISVFVDYVVNCLMLPFVKSAGNTGGGITAPADAYNVISVAATRPDFTRIAVFSSRGLTDDGRCGIRVAAPGTEIISTNYDFANAVDFSLDNGTSMAAPHVSGLAAVLWDYGFQNFLLRDPRLLRAVIMNSANHVRDDNGNLWSQTEDSLGNIIEPLDDQQGTGQIDALAAFNTYRDTSKWFVWGTHGEDAYFLVQVKDAPTTLKVTLTWNRHVTDYNAPVQPLLNNLDLYLKDSSLDDLKASISPDDNVQHICYDISANGTYWIRIDPDDLSTDGWEVYAIVCNYSMIWCGDGTDTTPPDTTIIDRPSSTIPYNDVTFQWIGSDDVTPTSSLEYSYYLEDIEIGWLPYTSDTSITYFGLADGTYTFHVRARDQAGNVDLTPDTWNFTVQVSPPSLQYNSYAIRDFSYGNGDNTVNPGEFIEIMVYLRNTGTVDVYDVTAVASTTSLYVNTSGAYPSYLTPYFGDILGRETAGGYMSFMVSNAPDGTVITFDLTITDSSNNTWYESFDVTVTGTDTIPPRAVTLQTSSQILYIGNTVNIVAFVEEGDDMSSGSVVAQIETSNKAGVATVNLYDDGLHNDGTAGDRVYGGFWTVTLPETDYFVSILTSDNSGNSAEWADLAGFTTRTFIVSNKILVVDDDNNNLNSYGTEIPYQTYYTSALDANGLPYDVWEYFFRGSPDSSILTQYDIVIWLSGDTYGESYFSQGYYTETLSSTDQANLITYLESGGSLFMCGQDIGYDVYIFGDSNDKTFYNNYLHADFVQDTVSLYRLHGVAGDPITEGLSLDIYGGDGANNQKFASEIDPINGATTIFTYDSIATSGQLGLPQSTTQRKVPFGKEQEVMQTMDEGSSLKGVMSSGSGAISADTGTYKVVYFAFGLEAINNSADRNILMRKVIQWLHGPVEGSLPQLFNTNSYMVVGDTAYCTDVLGTAKISYGLALGGASENPEGRTDIILTQTEHDTGNLIIVGGPAVNPAADEFDTIFGITYNFNPGISFEIFCEGESIYLDLAKYPQEDICILYLGEHNLRDVMIAWGYGWEGTYAGSAFIGDPANWQAYEGAHMLMLRWRDSNGDGLVQMPEITVEAYKRPLTAKTVIRGVVNWVRGVTDWVLSLLFNTNSYMVVGDTAYCTDVLGTAKISYGLALGGASENPEGRTDIILTQTEHDTGNLIIVGGPAVNPTADEFDQIFNISYIYNPGVSFQINAEGESIYLNLANYPERDICIVHYGEHNGRNVMLVWGFGWWGTYAGSVLAGDPETWQTYSGAHMLMLRWMDSNGDGLVQKSEIIVEKYV